MFRTRLLVMTTFSLLCNAAISQSIPLDSKLEFSSNPQQTATIELFTSHGCSSCPPADAWLRQYVDHPQLWEQVIPMAFHVDYWDYLGWPDEFANADNTQRQQNYARSGRVKSVYTPGVVVKGREWRGFFRRQQPDLSLGDNVGVLQLSTNLESATIRFEPSQSTANQRITAHVAILGFDIQSDIGGGENRGRVLAEDFVILDHNTTQQQIANNQWDLNVPDIPANHRGRLAIVAWISDRNGPAPLQATGGWLPVNS